uniref:Rho-GAP domain-containing protein n=1 Tax=Schizophyllum commune (strain H4-8 / FGSC 9210) TaxID=578458 RepID=D8QBF2_SCHCM
MPPALSLKQRLAALSLAPSAPSSPSPYYPSADSPTPTSPRRKSMFHPPWLRRNEDGPVPAPQSQHEKVQEVMNRMIFQAGVDYETRPMVVMCASALPDPKEVNYDVLLTRILAYLNLYVESDYTVVFFAAGGRHTPGWNWVWKAYRSLSRKYRKNLKRLYIVHSTFFSKMLFSLAGAIISAKFFRKIEYISTLSELAYHVPLTQIDIPPAVYQENAQYEREIVLPMPVRSSVFGVPLEELMGYDGEKGGIPRVVKDCIQFLRETGLHDEGLFRRSPQTTLLRAAQAAYDRGQTVSLETFGDPHLAAVLLKKYFRDLPEPIFPDTTYPIIRKCPVPTSDPADMSAVLYIRENILPELMPCAYILLSHVLHLMHEVSLMSASNRMDAHNLAIVLCPNLVSSKAPMRDVMMCSIPNGPSPFDMPSSSSPNPSSPSTPSEGCATLGMVIKLCIQRYYEIFDEVRDRSEAIAPTTDTAVVSSSASTAPASGTFRIADEDEEDSIDDIAVDGGLPSHGRKHSVQRPMNGHGPPSAFRPRHRTTQSGMSSQSGVSNRSGLSQSGSGASLRSAPAPGGRSPQHGDFGTVGRARSTISIDHGGFGTIGAGGKKGSISVGRGTTRKAAGAGVEAIGITAAGFFTPPSEVVAPSAEAEASVGAVGPSTVTEESSAPSSSTPRASSEGEPSAP